MPKVTDKQYQLPGFLIEKMDLAAFRVQKRKLDSIFIVDGDEGFGKTGISFLLAYYIAHKTGREFNLDNVFFDPMEVVNYVNSTKKKVIVWDEAALGGLASNWQNKMQQLLIQTLMTCRSRQHIIFFNIPKFYRLNRYFITDRPIGLVHVYSPNKLDAGFVAYYKEEDFDNMLSYYYKTKRKPYKKYYKKELRGKFPDGLKAGIIDEDEYDKKKEHYTQKLLTKYSLSRRDGKLLKLQYKISQIPDELGVTQKKIANIMNVSGPTIINWSRIPEKYPQIFKKTS